MLSRMKAKNTRVADQNSKRNRCNLTVRGKDGGLKIHNNGFNSVVN